MKKYEITITDKQTWITPREKRDIDTEDRFEVVVEAKNEDEAFDKAERELRFAIGYDNAKHNFECSNIQKENDYE